MSELCTVMCPREICASARVQLGVVSTLTVAFMTFATVWTRNCQTQQLLSREMVQDCSQTYRLIVATLNLSPTHAVPSCYKNVNSMLSYFTVGLSICCLATRAGAFSANFETMKTNFTMLGLVTSLKMMMVVGVLIFAVLQIVPPNSYSTIPSTLVVKGLFVSTSRPQHGSLTWL